MNPLVSLITVFLALKKDLTDRFNAALANRPVIEQVEGANLAATVIRELDWAKDRLERMGSDIATQLTAAATIIPGFTFNPSEAIEVAASRLIEAMNVQTVDKAITDGIAAKTLIRTEDHENALTAARQSAEQKAKEDAEADFKAQLKTIELLAARRKEAIEKVGLLASQSLTDEVLSGDGFQAALDSLTARKTKLEEKNITEAGRPEFYASLIAKSSDAEFDSSLDLILKAAGADKLAPIAKTPAAPAAAAPGFSASTPTPGERTKKVIC
jgi:hypothetical protein